MGGAHGIDILVSLTLPGPMRQARRVETPSEYSSWFQNRETIVYENQRADLPRAVIFRDSTSQFVVDLLAQHFSRSVFVWHQGQVVKDVVERERPDVVIHAMAERFVTPYCEFPSLARARDEAAPWSD
jgi:hypothetical protein